MSRKIINSYSRYKEFRALIDGGDYVAAVRSGLDFLRFVGEEYILKEVFMHQKYDGDDFFAREVEDMLANVLRFAELVIDDLRQRLQYAKSGDYGYIVDELSELLDAGAEAKNLAVAFAQEILVKYRNRPALIRRLIEKTMREIGIIKG